MLDRSRSRTAAGASTFLFSSSEAMSPICICGVLAFFSRAGVEEWKSGRVEEWKSGRVEEWKSGRVEGWKGGRVEGWKSGSETE